MTDALNFKKDYDNENGNMNYKQTGERSLRRSTSLLEPKNELCGFNFASLRNPESLFGLENRDKFLSPKLRGEREYRRGFSAGRIQEFPNINTDNNLESFLTDSISACDSSTNLQDSASSRSIISCESSPANSFSNIQDHSSLSFKSKPSRNFEIRLLAAESLIKASKFKNLDDSKIEGNTKFDPSSKFDSPSKFDGNKSDVISEMVNSMISKRNRSIPLPRFRSSSLNREFSLDENRRKSFTGSSTDKLLFQKFPKFQRHEEENNPIKDENDTKVEKAQRRISRFLRPDFFDTPREESQYVKEKEAKKALENERRKSRFMKKPIETAFEASGIISDLNNLESIKNETPIDENTESSKLCPIIQSLSSVSEMEKCEPTSGDSALYIPEINHVNEKTIDENSIQKKCSKNVSTNVSKSKTVPRIEAPCKEEVKTSESPTNMRLRSKIPTKFKKNESNCVKKIVDNKLTNKNSADVSSLKKKKDSELSLLQRSKTEVKKSLEQCSKLVKKYSLENSKKVKNEKEVKRTNSMEKEKSSERNLEKNSSRNIVQVEIVSGKSSPETKLERKLFKSREESQESNGDVSEENGKKIIRKAGILPSLSKINSSIKGNQGEKKLMRRTKVKEVNEKENDSRKKENDNIKKESDGKKKENDGLKKKENDSIKKKEDTIKRKESDSIKRKENETKLKEADKKKEIDQKKGTETCIKKKENEIKKKDNDTTKKKICTLKKSNLTIIEKRKQSPETSDDSEKILREKLLTLVNNHDEKEKNSGLKSRSLSNKSITNESSPANKMKLNESKIENMKIILDTNTFYKRCQSTDNLGIDNFYENPQNRTINKELSKSPDLSENTEYFNLYYCPSDCEMNNTRSEANSSALPVNSTTAHDQQEQESIIDRIRRKSFYSRFNDRKRKTLVSPLSSRTDMWPSMTLPKNFSFTSSKKNDSRNSEKRYSLYNNILSDSKNTDRNRYSFCSDNSVSSIDSLQNNVSMDLPRRKYSSSTDFSLNKNHFGNNTLPRKKEINKFHTMGHCEEETSAGRSFSSIPNESFESQCCSNDFTMGNGDSLLQSWKKD